MIFQINIQTNVLLNLREAYVLQITAFSCCFYIFALERKTIKNSNTTVTKTVTVVNRRIVCILSEMQIWLLT